MRAATTLSMSWLCRDKSSKFSVVLVNPISMSCLSSSLAGRLVSQSDGSHFFPLTPPAPPLAPSPLLGLEFLVKDALLDPGGLEPCYRINSSQ